MVGPKFSHAHAYLRKSRLKFFQKIAISGHMRGREVTWVPSTDAEFNGASNDATHAKIRPRKIRKSRFLAICVGVRSREYHQKTQNFIARRMVPPPQNFEKKIFFPFLKIVIYPSKWRHRPSYDVIDPLMTSSSLFSSSSFLCLVLFMPRPFYASSFFALKNHKNP